MIEILRARLLAAHSATAVLEAWCAERGLAGAQRLAAQRLAGPDKPASKATRARLCVPANELVRFRRVRLVCGVHVLSEAENWYVPARLTAAMNEALETTQTPFGRIVDVLGPVRRNLALHVHWQPVGAGGPGPDEALFSLEAVLARADGVPFCEVFETYRGGVLAGAAA